MTCSILGLLSARVPEPRGHEDHLACHRSRGRAELGCHSGHDRAAAGTSFCRAVTAAIEPLAKPATTPARGQVDSLLAPAGAGDQPTEYAERLVELERRLAALELGSASGRMPVTATDDELPPEHALRELVLDWVADDREARRQAEELEGEEERRKQLEFDARYQALMMAQEHGLASWQRDKFAELFIEIGQRAQEIEQDVDLQADDPEEVEARWVEYDEWVDQLERELTARLDPELYDKIYGDD